MHALRDKEPLAIGNPKDASPKWRAKHRPLPIAPKLSTSSSCLG